MKKYSSVILVPYSNIWIWIRWSFEETWIQMQSTFHERNIWQFWEYWRETKKNTVERQIKRYEKVYLVFWRRLLPTFRQFSCPQPFPLAFALSSPSQSPLFYFMFYIWPLACKNVLITKHTCTQTRIQKNATYQTD